MHKNICISIHAHIHIYLLSSAICHSRTCNLSDAFSHTSSLCMTHMCMRIDCVCMYLGQRVDYFFDLPTLDSVESLSYEASGPVSQRLVYVFLYVSRKACMHVYVYIHSINEIQFMYVCMYICMYVNNLLMHACMPHGCEDACVRYMSCAKVLHDYS